MSAKRRSPKPSAREAQPVSRETRLTKVRVSGMRTLDDVTLDLGQLTVLIGDNGGGKSSILEACEILRRSAANFDFIEKFNEIHGGLGEVCRPGKRHLGFGVEALSGNRTLSYEIALGDGGIERELLKVGNTIHLDR